MPESQERVHQLLSPGLPQLLGVVAGVLVYGCSQTTAPTHSGPPAALHIVTGNAQSGNERQLLAVPLTVQVLDAAGRGLPGVVVDWQVAGGGSLLARAFPTATDSVGLALVLWQLGSLFGSQSVTAVCCGSMEASFTAQAVLPLTQRLTLVSGAGQLANIGHTLPQPITVRVLQANGTRDVGTVVGWGTHTPGGHFSPTFARTDSLGQASTNWTVGTVAGEETSWVSVRALPPLPVLASAAPGPAVRLAIMPTPAPTLGFVGDWDFVTAKAWDSYGNATWGIISFGTADTSIAHIMSQYLGPAGYTGLPEARHHGTTRITAQTEAIRDSVPLTVLGFSAASEGGDHTCGVSVAGDAYCWGPNALGAIGDGTTTDRRHPALIGQGLGLQLPIITAHTCAVTASGQAYCWGPDESGQLGDGSPTYATEVSQVQPVPVAGRLAFSSVRAGQNHTCAVATSGDAYCWGANNDAQLGRDTATYTCRQSALGLGRCSNWPILVTGGLQFTQVSAGWEQSCGVTTSGAAYCWGLNDSGQLGNDSTTDVCGSTALVRCSYVPRLVEGGLTFKSVSAGAQFTCGVAASGDGYCWGFGVTGSLGNGAGVSSTVPVKVAGGLSFTDLQAGGGHACGLTTTGKVYCWGYNYPSTPAQWPPSTSSSMQFSALAVGGDLMRVCAVTTLSDLYCY